ncbi:MAG: hypothetical protein M3Q29_02060 [Chloroflexota bacterium]|nr:hypothetical protein [Chloroflexota bacterium]
MSNDQTDTAGTTGGGDAVDATVGGTAAGAADDITDTTATSGTDDASGGLMSGGVDDFTSTPGGGVADATGAGVGGEFGADAAGATDADLTGAGAADAADFTGATDDADVAGVDVVAMGIDVDGDGTLDAVVVDAVATDDTGAGTGSGVDLDPTAGNALTGTRDPVYDLVSVLYHALQGAETNAVYADDALFGGDAELVDFFAEVQSQDRARAERAKTLLRRYLAAES